MPSEVGVARARPRGSRPDRTDDAIAPGRGRSRGPWAAASLALVSAVGFVASYLLLVSARSGRDRDIGLERRAQTVGLPTQRTVERLVDVLAPRHVAVLVTLVVIGLVLQRHWYRALAVVLGAGGTAVSVSYLKAHLVRPLDVGEKYSGNSFPSGHVAVAAVLAGALVLATGGAWRVVMSLVAVALVVGMGYATVVLRWHRPSDGVGGAFLACFFFAAAVVAADVVSRLTTRAHVGPAARHAAS